MNGIEKIISRIEADAAAEAAAIKAESDGECAAISAEYESRAAAEYEKLAQEAKQAADTRYDRICGGAKLDAKKEILLEKQKLMSAAFDRAAEKLASLPDGDYVALCARLAAGASFSGREELIFSPSDRAGRGAAICDAANDLLKKAGRTAALTVSDETRDIRGGVILRDGKIEMNCSIELLVAGLKNDLSPEVAAVLFN